MNQPSHGRPAAPAATRTSKLAIWAIALSVLGVCFFPIAVIGGVLGIVALVKMSKDPALGGKVMAIVSIALVGVSIFTTGITAAIAIPAFIGYVRRAKTSEATGNMNLIYKGIDSRYREDGHIVVVPLTPDEVPCGEPHAWSPDELARFAPLGFDPGKPTHFSYAVLEPPPGSEAAAIIRAHADLDCDGNHSLFELVLSPDGSGGLAHAQGFYIEDEIE